LDSSDRSLVRRETRRGRSPELQDNEVVLFGSLDLEVPETHPLDDPENVLSGLRYVPDCGSPGSHRTDRALTRLL